MGLDNLLRDYKADPNPENCIRVFKHLKRVKPDRNEWPISILYCCTDYLLEFQKPLYFGDEIIRMQTFKVSDNGEVFYRALRFNDEINLKLDYSSIGNCRLKFIKNGGFEVSIQVVEDRYDFDKNVSLPEIASMRELLDEKKNSEEDPIYLDLAIFIGKETITPFNSDGFNEGEIFYGIPHEDEFVNYEDFIRVEYKQVQDIFDFLRARFGNPDKDQEIEKHIKKYKYEDYFPVCKYCKEAIYWQKSKRGKWYPTNSSDRRDFHDCR
jgi:hypothetical protein